MSRRDRALMRNAADPNQVKYAARKERQRQTRLVEGLAEVLGTAAGRMLIWELLTRAGVYQTIWDPSAKIHYNAGKQDFGHELLALCLEANEEGYLLMEREARQWERRLDRETEAVHAAAVTEGEPTNG